MEQQGSNFIGTKRYAIVTGSNKGIGFEMCKQLASKGIEVILKARDEKRGLEALEKLYKDSELSKHVVFHQLDVTDPVSIASLADFIKLQFGKLDILINNAGVGGVTLDALAFRKAVDLTGGIWPEQANWKEMSTQPHELAEECLKTNYYGAKSMVEALLPLLQLSDWPRIINVSSFLGLLEYMPNEWAKRVFSDTENLTEERIGDVVAELLKDLKEGMLEIKGWPTHLAAYKLSKAALNAYTMVLAKKNPSVRINSMCPGFVKTDINCNTGSLTTAEGAQRVVSLALLPNSAELSGLFYVEQQVSSF